MTPVLASGKRILCFAVALLMCGALVAPVAWASDGTPLGSPWTGFARPHDAVVANGDVYVLDTNNLLVKRMSPSGTLVASWAVPANCYGIGADQSGNIYVADSAGFIRKYDAAGTAAGSPFPLAAPGARDVAVDATGNIYVTRQTANAIRKYNSSGVQVAQWTTGVVAPRCIVVAPNGDLYFTEFQPSPTLARVTRMTDAGVVVDQWGAPGSGDGEFNGDIGIGASPSGNIYVTEYLGNRIQAFSPTGDFLTKWASGFNGVRGIALDGSGNAYVADTDNNRVVAFGNTAPTVSLSIPGYATGPVTVAPSVADTTGGIARVEFWVDGSLLQTVTSAPYQIVWDASLVPTGVHTIEVRAFDVVGNTTTGSAQISTASIPQEPVSVPASTTWVLLVAGLAALAFTLNRRHGRATE